MRRTTVAALMMVVAALAGCGRLSKIIAEVRAQEPPPPDPANVHNVTVKFDYDFTKTPVCSPNTTSNTCIKDFIVYDISHGQYKLFTIPAPTGATGVVKGITAEGPHRTFEPGMHIISVTAENAAGAESDTSAAKTSVAVKRKDAAAPSATPAKQ